MDLLNEAQELFEFTCAVRRDLHRHPELGFEEFRTAGIVAAELNRLGLETTTGVGKTGVVGMLEGARPGPTILMRFDMDALPVTEETGAEYSSQIPGKMHACGHDGHVAVGLTVARLLSAHRQELAGNVKMVFQPAEEGLGGAEAMLAGGVLANPRPDLTLALHLWNEKPLGWVGVVPGPMMAGAEIFHVHLSGKGGHGALPDMAIDPMAAAAQVITALQTIVSRNVSPLKAAVVSVTRVWGGETFNVIPPSVELQGTIRTFEEPVRARVLERFRQIVEGIASAMGCQAEIDLKFLTPAVVNEPALASRLKDLFPRVDPQIVVETNYQTMGSEDMAYLMREVPGCYFLVGSANPERNLNYSHHHPRFDFDEAVLPRAAAFMAAAAVDLLHPQGQDAVNGLIEEPERTEPADTVQTVQVEEGPSCYLLAGAGRDPDQLLEKVPERVVSLVPSLTESLFDLGIGANLVGITDYCIYPEGEVRNLPRVGGPKDAHLTDLLALKPDLVIASQEENSRELVEALQAAGVTCLVANSQSVAGSIEVLWRLVDLFHSQPAGLRLRTLEMALDWARTAQASLPEIRYFCPIWQDKTAGGQDWWMVFNRRTYANDLLQLFGGKNIFADRERRYPLEADLGRGKAEPPGDRDARYPRVTLDEILSAEPEMILLPSEPFNFDDPYLEQFGRLFAETPAGKNGRILQVDGSLITWFGTRLGRALSELPSLF